ncbi:MAG: hypothetical protein A2487_07000 [Candidatus Raymondbacteria bacterium RifOxyC12_full_50_8]|uniref:tetrahydrofolate synthase n=1 Tax=Candidatus Raymondbacteria bacterium RIFOXYD12_FULL_49_13 TaxID=1817890 RepID=A0A1F7FC19_UNCRA|nr:MAG: hypothetical protein A2350_00055 [Candidatus Raymondbacteria bacterium RifOxyB12_full_50_8]OGJ89525.1 MAG: hypothetical protein A2248_03360 [Candidatus Raymondbacteria bacterium RIFOXYA2_FULL_49_16]OGJ96800.1 MAG: hypothetical protein A2487_07000 [Candidatus Raymondbacteria bacterium RifOxyC12_full_50_8]OGK04224.1 MAG: hypothetical protein A2519_17845 [Candidatus Raymondbacteria bacterium RIFOXYD12_FULL_49_13]OGP42493.1 MAG: hypothetical protein A2324_17395 [Candidatus Raymondbacteria b
MEFSHTLDYLYSLQTHGIKLGLDRVSEFLRLLRNPHTSFASIHIAGSNGKGSIARLIYEALRAQGYSVGLYTSPHLIRFNERIVTNNEEISDEEICRFVEAHRHEFKDLHLTFFEATTALAFDHFRNQKVDVAVLETGMGGRLDATNIVTPLVSVIGDISIDHEQYLGSTIEQIAGEKAGIIKNNVPVVIGIRNQAAKKVVLDRAPMAMDAFTAYNATEISETATETAMTITGPSSISMGNIVLRLPGAHQVRNALAAVAALKTAVPNVRDQSIRKGFANARVPGRLQLQSGAPEILFDVAHNPAKITALNDYLSRFFTKRNIVIVFGVMADKDTTAMLKILDTGERRFVLTRPATERACDPALLAGMVRTGEVVPEVAQAVTKAVALAGKSGLVVVTGSFYTVGEAL